MIYLQRFPFPYEVLAWSSWGEIERVGAPMETILRACREWAHEHGYQVTSTVVQGIAPL